MAVEHHQNYGSCHHARRRHADLNTSKREGVVDIALQRFFCFETHFIESNPTHTRRKHPAWCCGSKMSEHGLKPNIKMQRGVALRLRQIN